MHQDVPIHELSSIRKGEQGARTPTGNSKQVIVTFVEPSIWAAMDAAGDGSYRAVHARSIGEAEQAVRRSSARALLLSPRVLDRDGIPAVTRLVVKCPGMIAAAVLSETDRTYDERLLRLGACGVRELIDLRVREGWNRLRDVVQEAGNETAVRIMDAFLAELGEANDSSREFVARLVREAPRVKTVRAFARAHAVRPSTMMSRFWRARLPSPKQYLAGTRLIYASSYLRSPKASIADVSHQLEYSSPQSFGRHVRMALGVSAGELRERYSFENVLDHFTSNLITPHRRTFEWFDPLGAGH